MKRVLAGLDAATVPGEVGESASRPMKFSKPDASAVPSQWTLADEALAGPSAREGASMAAIGTKAWLFGGVTSMREGKIY